MDVELGRAGQGQEVHLSVDVPTHILVSGRTRSGKSAFVYLLLARLLKSLPSTQVWGVDPTGILFNPMGCQGQRVSQLLDPEAVCAVMESCVGEMTSRISSLLKSGRDKVELSDVPLVLVVLEELPAIFAYLEVIDKPLKPAERFAPRFNAAFQRLVSESAKVNIRVLAILQRADVAGGMSGYVRSQFGTKVSFAQDLAGFEMVHTLSEEEERRATGFLPGQGFIESPGQELTMFRADHLTYERFKEVMSK